MNVLLVDDDRSVRITLGALLEDEGLSVIEAGSLEEARLQLGAVEFRLVVLDHLLPDGSGLDLVPQLRGLVPMPRIVMLTGLDGSSNLVDLNLIKAMEPEQLVHQLVELCGGTTHAG